jgi:predicted nuclease of restriction endonuclease-like (RecB) superfamily
VAGAARPRRFAAGTLGNLRTSRFVPLATRPAPRPILSRRTIGAARLREVNGKNDLEVWFRDGFGLPYRIEFVIVRSARTGGCERRSTPFSQTLQEIKSHLRSARIPAVLAANPIVIEAYWKTGKIILARQQEAAWGANVIDRLAADLKLEFPDMGGLSVRNLLAMKIFAREFPDDPIARQPVAQLPWGHVLQIMQRAKDPAIRLTSPPSASCSAVGKTSSSLNTP